MRVYALYIVVAGLAIYAWKDWFVSLCGLILLMAFAEHPDMPTMLLDIQGLNPWNVLLATVVFSWAISRRRQGLVWDMPRHVNVLLLLYVGLTVLGFIRLMADGDFVRGQMGRAISDHMINPIKWVIPGLLLFSGCRTRRRMTMALFCILAVYVLLAAQTARRVPFTAVLSFETLVSRRGKIQGRVGYGAVTMSMVLAGGAWAVLSAVYISKRWLYRMCLGAASVGTVYAMALTGGRMGYLAWFAVGLVLCVLRWRRHLVLAPIVIILIVVLLPGPVARMMDGLEEPDAPPQNHLEDGHSRVSSGRFSAWPDVIRKIAESPLIGYGRLAMLRTGLQKHIEESGEASSFGHAHNAYLEILLESGLGGLLVVVCFFGTVLVKSVRLFRDRCDPLVTAVGGTSVALVTAFLVSCMGSQHFYPREATMGMWSAIFLMLRAWVMRARASARIHAPAASPPMVEARPIALG